MMSDGSRTRLVIVGGGTAGWLAALMVSRFAGMNKLPIDVTVIESSQIPTIGVGEGTTAVFSHVLQVLNIDEATFIRETGATLKLGIRHRDWSEVGKSYDGPIDDPNGIVEPNSAVPLLDSYAISKGLDPGETHLFGQLMRSNRAPYAHGQDGRLIPASPFKYAYHFDQARVGAFLKRHATDVTHVDATVEGIDTANGRITGLQLADGSRAEGDFFIDCTGFRRALIGKAGLGASWVSFSDNLPVNRAMPFWLDHSEGTDIPNHTLSRALSAGWMWQIPTQDRMGCGYVYSDAHLTPEHAQAEVEEALGHAIEPRNDIKFDSGRLDRTWIGNCLALGLASSFLEPLEATSIHATVTQLMLFTEHFLAKAVTASGAELKAYNDATERQLDDFRTFLNLHYMGRRTEPFWQDVRNSGCHDRTRELLELWSKEMPRRSHFKPFPGGVPHVEEQLYIPVLAGLGHLDKSVAKQALAAEPTLRRRARQGHESLLKEYRGAAEKCMTHREFLASLDQ